MSKPKPVDPLPAFVKSLRTDRERREYVRAVRTELANAGEGFISRGAVPPLRMVGDVLGVFRGAGKGNTGKSGAQTPIQIPPTPPFSPEQWMSAAAMAAWNKFPERAASVGLTPPPYPTASTQIEGQVPPADPTHTRSVVSAQRVLQFLLARFNPIRGLTPKRLGEYIEQWMLGFLRWHALAWNEMRDRDDQIKAVVAKREFLVSRLKWEIIKDEDSDEANAHAKALEAAYRNITCTHALDQNRQGGVQLLILQMMRAIGDKFAVHEIVWKPEVDETGAASLSAHFRFVPLWFFENRTGALRYLPYELALDGIPLDWGGWLITVGDGLGIATSIAYIYKQLGLRSWANFVDKYGMPFVIGKTDAAYGSPEWDQMVAAISGISSDGSLVTNLSAQVDQLKVEGLGSGETAQHKFVDFMNRQISILWRGGDLSTNSRGGSGASGALPQLNQEEELAEADAIKLSESLNFYFDRPCLRYLFGTANPKAHFKIVPPENIDTAKEIALMQFLMSIPNFQISLRYLREKFGVPEPDPKDEIAQPPVASSGGEQIGKGVGDGSPTGPLSLGNIANTMHAAEFMRVARKRMTLAQAKALAPLAKEVRRIYAVENDEQRQAELAALRKDLPRIFKRVSDESGELVKQLEDIIGTSLVSGAVESALAH
jgi:phage gp29-like protein